MQKIIKQLFNRNLPDGFRLLNLSILIPILLWPIVFMSSIFMFDTPENSNWRMILLFFTLNAYPLYLILIAYFNSLLFQKNGKIGLAFPIFFLACQLIAAALIYEYYIRS